MMAAREPWSMENKRGQGMWRQKWCIMLCTCWVVVEDAMVGLGSDLVSLRWKWLVRANAGREETSAISPHADERKW